MYSIYDDGRATTLIVLHANKQPAILETYADQGKALCYCGLVQEGLIRLQQQQQPASAVEHGQQGRGTACSALAQDSDATSGVTLHPPGPARH